MSDFLSLIKLWNWTQDAIANKESNRLLEQKFRQKLSFGKEASRVARCLPSAQGAHAGNGLAFKYCAGNL